MDWSRSMMEQSYSIPKIYRRKLGVRRDGKAIGTFDQRTDETLLRA